VDRTRIVMLQEENVLSDAAGNALESVFGVRPTPLAEGLRRTLAGLPDQPPEAGVGDLRHKRFWIDIDGSAFQARYLARRFRAHYERLLDVDAATPAGMPSSLEPGRPLILALPDGRQAQARVAAASDDEVLLVASEGHPLAGAVRFGFEDRGVQVRFAIDLWFRPATLADAAIHALVGGRAQDGSWRRTAENVLKESGGRARDGVQEREETLSPARALEVERRIAEAG
jgi:hypothetical protein